MEWTMFGIGPMELIVIAIIAVVFIGPQRLPEAMKKIGRLFVQLRRHTNDVRQGFNDVVRDAERELELERIKQLKDQVDQLRDASAIESKIRESIDVSGQSDSTPPQTENHTPIPKDDYEYHDSHYDEGVFTHKPDGFMDTEALLDKAKEIDESLKSSEKSEKSENSENSKDQGDSKNESPSEAVEPKK